MMLYVYLHKHMYFQDVLLHSYWQNIHGFSHALSFLLPKWKEQNNAQYKTKEDAGLRGGMVGWDGGEVEGIKYWLSSKDNAAFIYLFIFGD